MQSFRNLAFLFVLAAATVPVLASATDGAEPFKQTQISFRPDTIVEAAFFRVGAGNQAELSARYLSKVLPLAESFGMKNLGLFSISEVAHGPDDARLWGLFQWPDLDARKRFEQDERFLALRAIRDELMDAFKIVHLRPKKAFTLTLRDDRMYEFAALWMNRSHGAHIEHYFEAAKTFSREHGVRMVDQLEVIGTSDRYPFLPEQVFLIEWPSEAVKSAWVASDAFQAAGWNRALAVDQLYGVESRFIFPR